MRGSTPLDHSEVQAAVEKRLVFFLQECCTNMTNGHETPDDTAALIAEAAKLHKVVTSTDPDGEFDSPSGALGAVLSARLGFESMDCGMHLTGVKLAELVWRLEDDRYWRRQADMNREDPSTDAIQLALDDFDAEFDPDYLAEKGFPPRPGGRIPIKARIGQPVPAGREPEIGGWHELGDHNPARVRELVSIGVSKTTAVDLARAEFMAIREANQPIGDAVIRPSGVVDTGIAASAHRLVHEVAAASDQLPVGEAMDEFEREAARITNEPYDIEMNDVLSDGRPSATIKAIGYDHASRVLQVEFVSGARYRYRGVDPGLYAEFLSAPSKGTFFDRRVKKGGYQYRRVTS